MTDKYTKTIDSQGRGHIIRDPNGVERWELSGKWTVKPGPKPGERKQPISVKLWRRQLDWLQAQPGGVTATIEALIEQAMNGG